MQEKFLKAAEVAKILQVSEKTLIRWRAQKRGPDFIRLGDGPRAPVRYFPVQKVSSVV